MRRRKGTQQLEGQHLEPPELLQAIVKASQEPKPAKDKVIETVKPKVKEVKAATPPKKKDLKKECPGCKKKFSPQGYGRHVKGCNR